MIDTHCHLLPGVDDGARTEFDAIRLARRFVGAGMRAAVCTPHFSRRYHPTVEQCEARIVQLRALLADLNVDLELWLAAELSPSYALEAPPNELTRRSIAGQYVILELDGSATIPVVEAVLERLGDLRLAAVLAHPERWRWLPKATELLQAGREAGGLVQVVAPSLAGVWGLETRLAAWRLVEDGTADLVASDAHTTADVNHVIAAAAYIADRYGEERRRELLEINPARVLSGTPRPVQTGTR